MQKYRLFKPPTIRIEVYPMKPIQALNDEQRALAERHLYVVQSVIQKHIEVNEHIYGFGFDDLSQEGAIFLCRAAATYRGGPASFETYARRVVRNGLVSYCRQMCRKQKRQIYLQAALDANDEDGCTYLDLQESDDQLEAILSRTSALAVLEAVKGDYQGVARLGIEALQLKVKGLSGADIAQLYGVQPNLVGAWIARAAKKLRENEQFMARF